MGAVGLAMGWPTLPCLFLLTGVPPPVMELIAVRFLTALQHIYGALGLLHHVHNAVQPLWEEGVLVIKAG